MTAIYDLSKLGNLESVEIEMLRGQTWVNANVNGTSDVSYNVSSITDVATGRIGVNFTIPFTNTNFVALGSAQAGAGANHAVKQNTSNLSTTRSDFLELNAASVLEDPTEWNILIIGDQ